MKIKIEDEDYPELLREIPSPPQKLYVLGDVKLLKSKSIAIIGSRVCTDEGRKIAENFAMELARAGITIVSGMAKGIDTAAHMGSLKVGGKTIAVLGGGFNHIFPQENIRLFEEIIKNGGAVVSEYKENEEPSSQKFVLRNRIVSGLSRGVFVVEAKHRSGTSITADFARRQEKTVFCIPHGLEVKEGIGTNRLIKLGAKLVTTPKDILKTLEIKTENRMQKEKRIELINVPDEYKEIYKYISKKPINADEICRKSKIDIGKINYILTMLELEGYIESLPGKNYIIS